ncbi:MAG: hypothetical protein LBJ97_02390 [Mycoplasmataceae bacterium]|nr:hypothetical protein [Mycoplasmataceae bacterium]
MTDSSNQTIFNKDDEIEFVDSNGDIYQIDDWINAHPINSNYFLCPDIYIKNDVSNPEQIDANFNIHIKCTARTVSIDKIINVVYNENSFDFDIPIYDPNNPKVRVDPNDYHQKIDPNSFTDYPESIQTYGMSSMTIAGINEFADDSKNKSGFYVNVEGQNLKDLYNTFLADIYYSLNSSVDFFTKNYWYITDLSLDEKNSYCRFTYDYRTGIIENLALKLTINGMVTVVPANIVINIEFGENSKYKLMGLFPYAHKDSTVKNAVYLDIAPYDATSYWHYEINIMNLYSWDHALWSNGQKKILFDTSEFLQGLYIKSWILDNFTNLTTTDNNYIRPNVIQIQPIDQPTQLYLKKDTNKTFFGNVFSAPNSGSAEPQWCFPEYAFENWSTTNNHSQETVDSILGFTGFGDDPPAEQNCNWNVNINLDTPISMPFYWCSTISLIKKNDEGKSAFDIWNEADGYTWVLGIMESFIWRDWNPWDDIEQNNFNFSSLWIHYV